MRVSIIIPTVLIVLMGCKGGGTSADKPQPEGPSIRERLPLNDRDMLLQPLLFSLDDLRKSIDQDLTLETYKRADTQDVASISAEYKVQGNDTLAIYARVETTGIVESFQVYFQDGHVFFIQHESKGGPCGALAYPCERKAKYYFDEGDELLAAFEQLWLDESNKMSEYFSFMPSEALLDRLLGKTRRLRLK